MTHYLVYITTSYDGYEWGQQAIVGADSVNEAFAKAEAFDWTHDNGLETQEIGEIRPIPEEEYPIVKKYFYDLSELSAI